jgi:hypothetical protein
LADGIFCAYLAYYFWYWGNERSGIIGDMNDGYVALPRCELYNCQLYERPADKACDFSASAEPALAAAFLKEGCNRKSGAQAPFWMPKVVAAERTTTKVAPRTIITRL